MIYEIDWRTVIISVFFSSITAHMIVSNLMSKVAENEKDFLNQVRSIVVKTIEEYLTELNSINRL
ncbi:hypothetical protein NE686_00345 [Tissierella carlieri]|uniref:Uncharacterized protein n=1 Tax=Tissierella carlieri TaxID=689904 RepID=A0ABT1S5A9_9FIRM|nr:hypothetical protein [Tissierella carlieri]MCQ4921517.1 hypothetical protein [Tissierella carlieri]